MAERSKAAVLKTVVAQVTVGSNPTPTAIIIPKMWRGAGVAELDCLLSSYGLTAIVGSNPTPSASRFLRACSSVDQSI